MTEATTATRYRKHSTDMAVARRAAFATGNTDAARFYGEQARKYADEANRLDPPADITDLLGLS